MLSDALLGLSGFPLGRHAFDSEGARVKKRIIGTIAVTAAGLASVTGLWPPTADPAMHLVPDLLAGQQECTAAGPCASKPAAATGQAVETRHASADLVSDSATRARPATASTVAPRPLPLSLPRQRRRAPALPSSLLRRRCAQHTALSERRPGS